MTALAIIAHLKAAFSIMRSCRCFADTKPALRSLPLANDKSIFSIGPRVKRKTINRNFCKPAQISGSRCRNETFVAQSTRPEAISNQLQVLSSATIFRWIPAAHECFHLGEVDSTFRNGDKSDQ
jgi:hypothetical protein